MTTYPGVRVVGQCLSAVVLDAVGDLAANVKSGASFPQEIEHLGLGCPALLLALYPECLQRPQFCLTWGERIRGMIHFGSPPS